jgi:hypothetical protein
MDSLTIEVPMSAPNDTRNEAALYWTAVSLIVCEGLSIDKAAERLGVETEDLRTILHRRQTFRPFPHSSYPPTRPFGLQQ